MSLMRSNRPAGAAPANLRMVSNERGAVLAFVALLLMVFLGMAALSIDLGMLYTARGEAQRTADAAAHAGAGHLMRAHLDEDGARDRAVQFAALNSVRSEWSDIRWDEDIDVLLDSQKVRVRVHRTDNWGGPIGTIFAGVLGFGHVNVNASAAAQAWPGVASDCILPFAIPDHWFVKNDDGTFRDATIGDVWDKDRGDVYIPAAEPVTGFQPYGYTGYGTDRIGQEIVLTSANPNDSPQPGWYYSIRLPESKGGNDYRQSIKDCWKPAGDFELGETLDKEPGNMVGPTKQGFGDIFNDPNEKDIYWDNSAEWKCPRRGTSAISLEGDCVGPESRRVRPVVMFDPEDWEIIDNGAKPVPITAFAGVFLDSWDGNNSVTVRFMPYTAVKAASEWEMCASCLLRVLRIVE